MKPIRIALIGCGKVAEKHVQAINELGSAAELVALCDIDRNRMEDLLKKINRPNQEGLALHTNSDSCLKRQDIDLVVITTSADLHIPLSLAALDAGKHVLVEKPLALSINDARHAVQAAKRNGRVLAVGLQTRYLSQIQAMKKAVDEGRFGKMMHGVISVRWNRNADYYKSSPWRNSWAMGGGTLMNQCIHHIDLLQWMMGPVASVYGEACVFEQSMQVEQVGFILLKFASGAIGVVESSSCIYPKNLLTSISLFGERGSVTLEGERLNQFKHWLFAEGGPVDQTILKTDEISHTPLYNDLIHAIRSGSSPLVSAETSLHSLEIVLAAYKSIFEGKPVQLPIDEFTTQSMIKGETL